jgi:hypothetical protein
MEPTTIKANPLLCLLERRKGGEEEKERLASSLVPPYGSQVVCEACEMVLASP